MCRTRLVSALSVAFLSFAFGWFVLPSDAQVTFFLPPIYSGVGSTFVADFNNDGKPDLLSSNGSLNLGNGDGTFITGSFLAGGSLAVADFNGDGKPDVLSQGTGTLQVQLGNGDGTFQAPVSTFTGITFSPPGGDTWNVIISADLNGDGKPDVVATNNDSLLVYLNQGNGTFSPAVAYSLGSALSPPFATGDFNADGRIDVAVLTGSAELVFLGKGDGTLETPIITSGISNFGITLAVDLNGDGRLDLLVGDVNGYTLSVLQGNGDGTFQRPTSVSIPNPAGGSLMFAAADLNGDGRMDVVLQPDPTVAQLYMQAADGTFSNPSSYVLNFPGLYHSYAAWSAAAISDFNLDGKPDIAAGNAVLLSNGDGSFQGVRLYAEVGETSVVGDFEKNGRMDLASAHNSVYIYHNDGRGALSLLHSYPLQQIAYGIVTADFNGDSNLDLLTLQSASSVPPSAFSYSVLLGNGDGSFQPPLLYSQHFPVNPSSGGFVVADFNGDHIPDLAVSGSDLSVAIFLGQGHGTFQPPSQYYDNVSSSTLMPADFNNDGKLDLAVNCSNGANPPSAAILYGNGDGTFRPVAFPPELRQFYAAAAADMNNDGNADLVGGQYSGVPVIALGNGNGNFTLLQQTGTAATYIPALADFNDDGNLDVFSASPNAFPNLPTGLYLGNGDGTLGAFVSVPEYGNVLPSLFADMNGDGLSDIIFQWPDFITAMPLAASGLGIIFNTSVIPPDFYVKPTTSTSQSISAGQTVSFTLDISPSGSFTGPVNLSCTIAPAVTAAPTCALSTSSVHISDASSRSVTLSVGTSAPVSSGTLPGPALPTGLLPVCFTAIAIASGLHARKTQLRPAAFTVALVLALFACSGCGTGGGSHTSGGTPAGIYQVKVVATAAGLSHEVSLKVIVQ